MPRHEKQVAVHLRHCEIEPYVPVYKSLRRWNNRQRVELDLPLFPGYVFVNVSPEYRRKVLAIPGVRGFVTFNGPPAEVSASDIESLRIALDELRVEPHPFLKIGQRVRIRYGPFLGKEGVLVKKRDRFRVVLSVDMFMQAMAVELEAADLELVN